MVFIGGVRVLVGLLLRPQHAARTITDKEPLWPAICVAVLAYLPTALRVSNKEGWQANVVYLAGIVCCIACNLAAYAIIARLFGVRSAASHRVRPFLLVSLYTTCFVACWAVVEPPMLFAMNDATFFWPFAGGVLREARKFQSLLFLGCSVIFYWWWYVLAVFAGCRIGWRRGGWLFVVVPPLSTWIATRAAYSLYNAMDF